MKFKNYLNENTWPKVKGWTSYEAKQKLNVFASKESEYQNNDITVSFNIIDNTWEYTIYDKEFKGKFKDINKIPDILNKIEKVLKKLEKQKINSLPKKINNWNLNFADPNVIEYQKKINNIVYTLNIFEVTELFNNEITELFVTGEENFDDVFDKIYAYQNGVKGLKEIFNKIDQDIKDN